MADPVTIGIILAKLFSLIKIGAAAYLIVRILKFERIKNWILSRWAHYANNPDVTGFWLKTRIDNEALVERDLHIFGLFEKMTGEVQEWEAAIPDSVDEEIACVMADADVVCFDPTGSQPL